jgi:hypothetical protein
MADPLRSGSVAHSTSVTSVGCRAPFRTGMRQINPTTDSGLLFEMHLSTPERPLFIAFGRTGFAPGMRWRTNSATYAWPGNFATPFRNHELVGSP